jgi:putative serine protease PepD
VTTPWDSEPAANPPARSDESAPDGSTSPAPPAPPAPPIPTPPAYPAPGAGSVPFAAPIAPAAYPARAFSAGPVEVPPISAAITPPEGTPRFVGAAQGPPSVVPPVWSAPPLRPEAAPFWSAGSVPPTPPPVPAPVAAGPARKGRGWMSVAVILGAVALLVAGFLAHDAIARNDPASSGAISGTNTSTTTGSQNTTPLVQSTGEEPVVAVAKALSPAVVQIQTTEGLGSGVVYDASGLIVTNQHVVGTAKTVQVNLSDGTKLQGTVQGADPSSDIAVVKIDTAGKTLTVAKLAAGEPNVGSIAVAIGSPFGLTGTVTAGVISAVDRPVQNERNVSVNMIQTDAPINPGNSGGALANRNGEVIGINAEIYSQSGENNGIGFAIPIQTAKTVADEITSGKIAPNQSVHRATLGVSIQASPAGDPGAYVANVVQGSAADKAGLQAGDLIVGIDGRQVTSASDLSSAITRHQPDDKITLDVQRDGQTVQVTAKLGTSGN